MIPESAIRLQQKLVGQLQNCCWNELEDMFGKPERCLDYGNLEENDRQLASSEYSEVKHFVIEEHNVYFLRHVSGEIHATCLPVGEEVTVRIVDGEDFVVDSE